MSVPESAIGRYHEVVAETTTAFAGANELHAEWRHAYDQARDLAAAYDGRGGHGFGHIPDLKRLPDNHPAHAKAREDIAAANAEAARRSEIAQAAAKRAQDLARLRDQCFEELRRRGVPVATLKGKLTA